MSSTFHGACVAGLWKADEAEHDLLGDVFASCCTCWSLHMLKEKILISLHIPPSFPQCKCREEGDLRLSCLSAHCVLLTSLSTYLHYSFILVYLILLGGSDLSAES